MNRQISVLALGLVATAVIAAPIAAQRGGGQDRPSRQCMREIANLCGRDRSEIPSCLQQKGDRLSDKCQAEMRERMGSRREQNQAQANQTFRPAVRPTSIVAYGNHPRQQVDVYEPKGAVDELPLVLFVHGGGWSAGDRERVQSKPAHFGGQEVYFASAGYRLLPGSPVEEQAKDVGAAVQALVAQAESLGFDADRIALMGHSAGAHLAALVGTDPQYAGEAFDAIQGVILLDGAAYDIAQNIEDAPFSEKRVYEDAFGLEIERQKALSPVTYIGGPDAPNWLALYVEGREIAKDQAELLVDGLSAAGSSARAVSIPETDHGLMNREIGTEQGQAQTEAVDAFLAEIFG
ncbi:MAG: alpha/beta hydrolase [Pseudomonadota bacterium]